MNLLDIFGLCVLTYVSMVTCALTTDTVDDEQLQNFIKQGGHVVVLFCEKDVDAHCLQADQRVHQASKVVNIKDLKTVVAIDSSFAVEYQFKSFPQIIYFRHKKPILYYAGENNMEFANWLESNQDISTKELNEDNFEHDTQASSGATTGDWFIMFYDSTECSWLVPTWDALASRLQQRIVVGSVDTSKNKNLKARFKLDQCLTLIFFRHGSLYKYDLKVKDLPSLASFAEGWYKNVAAVKVPVDETPFDKVTDTIATLLKNTKTKTIGLAIGGSVAVLTVFLLFCSFMVKGKSEKKKTE